MQFCRFALQKLLGKRPQNIPIKLFHKTAAPFSFSCRRIEYKTTVWSGAALLSLGWFSQSSGNQSGDNQAKITEADLLYKQNKFHEVYDLLKNHKDSDDVEILWRLCRVEYNISQDHATPTDEKRRLVMEAYEIISKALALDDTHFATHKWMSILLDAKSGYDGTKARISNLETTKQHLMKASEINPKDATTLYMIGLWCYQVADLPWYQRQIASAIFAKPPVSSYEEALQYFVKAEEVDPNFYSQNLLMLGKTYLKLNDNDKARHFLNLAASHTVATDDDLMAKKEAEELLKKLKPSQA